MPRNSCHFAAAFLLLAMETAPRYLLADNVRWLTGQPLEQALTQRVGLTWANVPLRQSLTRFCRVQKLAFVLDRRIDPDQNVELSFDDVPLEEAVQRIASRLNGGFAVVGSVAYFGPKPTAERIRTVAALRSQNAAAAPATARATWLQPKALKWPDAASPRELVEKLGRDNKLTLNNLEQIPHDLWAAGDLPPLPLTDRLTLLLGQFDLTYEPSTDGRTAKIVPMPERPTIQRSYTVAGSGAQMAERLRGNSLLASAEIVPMGNKLSITARQEEHDLVKALLAGRTAKRGAAEERQQVYTLQVTATVDQLLAALSQRLQLKFRIDREAIAAKNISLDQEVQLDVKEVSADELLRAVFDPAGLTFKRNDNVVEIVPK